MTSLSAQPAFAAKPTTTPSPKPGWGLGDKNHVHTGPPGHSVSVRTNDNVSISNSFTIVAQGTAKVVVNVVQNIFHIIHIG